MDIFNRVELLLGKDALEKIQSQRIIIFGVGGVGSWCAESLVRTGIQHLTIVDPDVVCESNVNRQLEATTKTIGQPKVLALKERLLEINPEADITALQERYSLPPLTLPFMEGEQAEQNTPLKGKMEGADYIIDCIDSLKDKASLLVNATKLPALYREGLVESHPKVFSSMGAALKVDPTQIRVAEFWKVRECPLGAALRKKLKRAKLELSQKVPCVYSIEKPHSGAELGSLSHITAIFGFTLAGLVIQDIIKVSYTEIGLTMCKPISV